MLVDNGSTDERPSSRSAWRQTAVQASASTSTPIPSRWPAAAKRLGTAAESVHSLVYFYNWSFPCIAGYALKWDADMVLTDAAVGVLRDLAWQLEADQVVVKIPRYLPLYVVDERHAFLDVGISNTNSHGRGRTAPATASSRRWSGSSRSGLQPCRPSSFLSGVQS